MRAMNRLDYTQQLASNRLNCIRNCSSLNHPKSLLQEFVTFHCLRQNRSYVTTKSFLREYPPHTLYPMPALSPTMENGTIASWNIREGEEFSAGTSLCSIETDKASVDFEAQDDGILAKILKQGPDAVDIRIGTPICVVVDDAADVSAFVDFVYDEGSTDIKTNITPKVDAPTSTTSNVSSSVPTSVVSSGTSILLPSARHLAESKGLDASVIVGSAKGGRVTKGDVIDAIAAGTLPQLPIKASIGPPIVAVPTPTAPTPAALNQTAPPVVTIPDIEGNTFHDLPNNKMRKIIASRLTDSKRDVPHFYTAMEVELDDIMKLRKSLASLHDVKVSVNDFVIRCSALALRDIPEVNATYDVKTDSIHMQPTVDISVAVATPTGLVSFLF